jgi:hypothetical protein
MAGDVSGLLADLLNAPDDRVLDKCWIHAGALLESDQDGGK